MNITDYLTQLCQHCGIQAEQVEEQAQDGGLLFQLTVSSDDAGLLIGHHGETIQALQLLVRSSFGREHEDKRLIVNVNDYLQARQEKLTAALVETAQKAQSLQKPVTFPMYLPPSERYFVHSTLSELPEYEDLESVSVGYNSARRLVIRPKQTTHEHAVED